MLGPVFVRETSLAPKRPKYFLARTIFALSLLVLVCTGYLLVVGTHPLRSAADLAGFGGWMFQLLSPFQLAVLTFQAAIGAASTVAVEKDRRTLILLLVTRITGFELVIGKLTAGVLGPLSMLLAAVPVFLMLTLMGGVSVSQVLAVELVTFASILVAAAIGVIVAFWREKTFQSVTVTVLVIVLWLIVGEAIHVNQQEGSGATWKTVVNPIRTLFAAAAPIASGGTILPPIVVMYLEGAALVTLSLVLLGTWKVRVWNPSREARLVAAAAEGEEADERTATWKVREARPVWDNPVLWREVRTWAYGRKVLFVRLVYLGIFLLTVAALIRSGDASADYRNIEGTIPPAALILSPLLVVSLVIVNALGVSSIVTERDVLAIDLLLVSDMSPREFIYGKLLGVLYVAKEVWVPPVLLLVGCWWFDLLNGDHLVFCILGALTLNIFAATLGVHCGLNYFNGRTATLTSLGTIFFLCLGVATCMIIMVGFQGSFVLQLAPFLAVIVGGGVGIYAALGWRRPSLALWSASFGLPFLTFYAIAFFLMRQDQLPVLLAVLTGYGFATAAMLVPAVSEFDVAMGRTRLGGEE